MFFRKPIFATVLAVTLTMGLTACGGQAYRGDGVGQIPGGSGNGGNDPYIPWNPDDGTGDEQISYVPQISRTFNLVGNSDSETISGVDADSILRVRVTPMDSPRSTLPSGSQYAYTNSSATSTCVSFNVTVNGKTLSTGVLNVNGGSVICPNAPAYKVLDFSDRLSRGSTSFQVQVNNARYDVYCQWLWSGMLYIFPPDTFQGAVNRYCSASLYPVYQNHTVALRVDIQRNGSSQ